MSFVPRFTYSNSLVRYLGIIEGARAVIEVLPLPPDTTLRLRHDALQRSTRSSTQIEGNPLDEAAVGRAIANSDRTGSDAEQEVRNYPILTGSGERIRSYELAPEWVEKCFKIRTSVSENSGS